MQIFKKISNFLFPFTCLGCQQKAHLLCPDCLKNLSVLKNDYCPFCARISKGGYTCAFCRKSHYLDGALIALNYCGLTRKIIKTAKYRPYLFPLLEKLTPLIIKKIEEWRRNYFLKENFILIPVPLTSRKKAERGFNQAEIIAESLAHQLKLPLNLTTLKKIKNTKTQSLLNLKERKENVKNSFWANSQRVKNKNFILIDDLITSGSTINEAARILKKSGAQKIWALVLARNMSYERY